MFSPSFNKMMIAQIATALVLPLHLLIVQIQVPVPLISLSEALELVKAGNDCHKNHGTDCGISMVTANSSNNAFAWHFDWAQSIGTSTSDCSVT